MGITETISFKICELFKLFVLKYFTFIPCLNSFQVNNNYEHLKHNFISSEYFPLIIFKKNSLI